MVPEAKGRALIAIMYHSFAMPAQVKRKSDASRSLREILAEIKKLDVPETDVDASSIAVMKPETRERPFSSPGWLFELKYDGFRMLAERRDGEARLFYRSGRTATAIFPELARAVAALPFDLVLDGEAVVLDAGGRPSFQRLQRRGQRTRPIDAAHAATATPATLFAFDLLALAGHDLRSLPLADRKALLRRVLGPETAAIRCTEEVLERGEDLYAAVEGLGLEGIVAKRADSKYRSGYSSDWLKVRVDRTADFAILGFSPGPGGFRKLHLGLRRGEGWDYAGTVGTGFTQREMAEIRARLEPAQRPRPFAKVPGERVVWVDPELVCEVRYKEWTEGGHLRHPVFLRLRDDKRPEECLPPAGAADDTAGDEEPPATAPLPLKLTNLDKVYWPGEGYTKGDLVGYYRAIAPSLLPYL